MCFIFFPLSPGSHKTTATHVRFAIGEPEQHDQIKKETQVSLYHLSGKTSTSHTNLVSGGDPTPPPHASAIFISIITITKAWKYVSVLLSSQHDYNQKTMEICKCQFCWAIKFPTYQVPNAKEHHIKQEIG